MKPKEIKEMVGLVGRCGYNEGNKARFKTLSRKFMRELKELLGVDAEVGYNAGGIAVSGDAALYGDDFHVFFNADGMSNGICYRTRKGRKDYSGGPNRWMTFESLERYGVAGLAASVAQMRRVTELEKEKAAAVSLL